MEFLPRPDPVRHPVPIPWGRWARTWAGPGLAFVGLAACVASNISQPRCAGGNETSAISTLRNITSCQAQFQAAAHVDEDGDGIGEAAGFLEMSGATAPRGRKARVHPVLSGAFRTLTASGEVARSGYLFRIFLVGKDGRALGEAQPVGFNEGDADPEASEKRWICYAWPKAYGQSGSRTLVVTDAADIYGTDCAGYSGTSAPRPGAALRPPPEGTLRTASGCLEPDDLLDAPLADGARARDGNVWKQIN